MTPPVGIKGAARRSAVAVEADRRIRARQTTLAGEIKSMRLRRGWTQLELARRAGVGRQVIGRAERGVGPIDVATIERIGIAFGVPLALGFDRDHQQDVADAGHLLVQETVLRLARIAGYQEQFELPTRPNEPWRSVDVALGSRTRRIGIDAECWNTFGDVGASARSSRRKVVELEQLVVARWGETARAALVWVVRDTARNRALIARYPEVFATMFTGSSRAWVAALTTGAEPPSAPGLVWCNTAAGTVHAWYRSANTEDKAA